MAKYDAIYEGRLPMSACTDKDARYPVNKVYKPLSNIKIMIGNISDYFRHYLP